VLAALGRNFDFTVAGGAAVTFILAMIIRPTSLCGSGAHASGLYDFLGWISCLGLLAAGVFAFEARKHKNAKIAVLLLALVATPLAIITLVVEARPTAGLSDSSGEHATLQASLRGLASGWPAGKHRYWLGPAFRGAKVYSTMGWASDAPSYAGGPDELAISVETYPGKIPADVAGRVDPDHAVIVHTASGQDVVIDVHMASHRDEALLAAAAVAVQPLPSNVTYSGCD
jgi:hypothetical protein